MDNLEIVRNIIKETALAVQQSTKQEHSGLIGDLHDNITVLKENHEMVLQTLERIEAQTIRTNGRVSSLEKWQANSKGMLTGFGIAATLIISLVVYAFNLEINSLAVQEKNTQSLIENHVNK